MAVALANKPDQGKDVSLLSSDVIESVGETFIRVLTHCRHRVGKLVSSVIFLFQILVGLICGTVT